MILSWERVGEIGVDAGLCWVGDPCYCVTPDADNHPAQTWKEFCDKLFSDPNYEKGFKQWDCGVSVDTGYGDGTYPVFIRRNRDGRVVEVKVVFDGPELEGDDHDE